MEKKYVGAMTKMTFVAPAQAKNVKDVEKLKMNVNVVNVGEIVKDV